MYVKRKPLVGFKYNLVNFASSLSCKEVFHLWKCLSTKCGQTPEIISFTLLDMKTHLHPIISVTPFPCFVLLGYIFKSPWFSVSRKFLIKFSNPNSIICTNLSTIPRNLNTITYNVACQENILLKRNNSKRWILKNCNSIRVIMRS